MGTRGDDETPTSCADGGGTSHYSDEDLFKDPPPKEECPICFLAQPFDEGETTHFSCCGKVVCSGCVHAHRTADNRNLCPFCRSPASTSEEEYIERLKKRAEGDDAVAIYQLACNYQHGQYGLRQNIGKAMKLSLRAGELGCAEAYYNVGILYRTGKDVEMDVKKAKYYYELAAMGGDAQARHNIGILEEIAGNMNIALKHWMIAVGAGSDESLTGIRQLYVKGYATKDDFEKALRSHKEAKDEMKSDQREAAAKFYVRT